MNSRLTIKHLEMIRAIARAGTLTRAAESLNISQPALSSRLLDAETTLRTKLFIRRGRRLAISAPGQLLLSSATKILEELSRVENVLLNLPDQAGQVLRIGLPQYASFAWLPLAMLKFQERFPNVELEIVSEASLQPRTALLRNEIDVALVSSPKRSFQIDSNRFCRRHLFRDEFVALLPADHASAGKPFLIAEDFVGETYITNSAIPDANREYELFFQPQAVSPERLVQVGFTEAVFDLVEAGIGTTITTRWIVESHSRGRRLVGLPLNKQGLGVHWSTIYAKNDVIGEQAEFLSELISTHREPLDAAGP